MPPPDAGFSVPFSVPVGMVDSVCCLILPVMIGGFFGDDVAAVFLILQMELSYQSGIMLLFYECRHNQTGFTL